MLSIEYPRINMVAQVMYLAQNKANQRFVTAIRLDREVLVIGTGGFDVFDRTGGKPVSVKFQDDYSIIRPLTKGEQVVLEV
jgi:hypothetical protein